MGCFIVESAGCIWLVQLDDAAVNVADGSARRVPPVGMDERIAARRREQCIAVAEEIDARVQLGQAALVLGVNDGERVDAGGVETAECVDAPQSPEPVEREKSFVGADAEDAATAQVGEVERVIRAD